MAERFVAQPDVEFIRRVKSAGGDTLKKCYQCATCSTVCELSPAEKPFPRKEMLWAQWGLKDKLIADPDVWLCHQCNDCTTRCPRDARPGDVLAAIRNYVYESNVFPRFMGKALATPAMLPILLLVPMLILAALIGINMSVTGHGFDYYFGGDEVLLVEFIPAGYTEMLFIAGNILIFLIAAVGLVRFYKGLQHGAARPGGPSFVSALVQTLVEIFSHKRFGECGQNRPRQAAHLMVMYGFILAAAAAGLALVRVFVFEHWMGMHEGGFLTAWIFLTKACGLTGGLGMLIGSSMMLIRRGNKTDDVGADGYPDRLFPWMIFLVGITGLFSWWLRALNVAVPAYAIYYVHLVFVFFLLWYMPYSKFAHMLYRGLAMVWAREHKRTIGRDAGLPPADQDAGAVQEETSAA